MIFIASCHDMTSSWLGTTQLGVVLCGRTFRTALILLLITWIFGSEPSCGSSLSRILATATTGGVTNGRSGVPAMFTVFSGSRQRYLSISLQLSYEISSLGIGVRGLRPGIRILLESRMLGTQPLFGLRMWSILRTSLLLS